MRPDRFLPQTWFDARLAPAPSAIHGTGLFATAAFDVGEVLMVWGGSVWTRAQLDAGEVPRCSFSFVDEDVLLAAPRDGLDYFVNHSCDPSAWMTDEVTVVARRAIPAGVEVTGDYALWEAEDEYLIAACACGSESCRSMIRGSDWRRPELQERYSGHFLPYIEQRFRSAKHDAGDGRARPHFEEPFPAPSSWLAGLRPE